jgi:hypothetical protein
MTTYIEPGPSSPSSANSALISPSDQPSSPARTKRERQLSRNHRPPIGNDGSSYSPSPSSPQMAPSSSHDTLQHQRTKPRSILTLPLFIPKETSSPSPSSPNGPRIGRRPSLQDSPSLSPPKRERFLPSHHASPSPPRGRLFTSPGNAGRENSPRREGGSPHPRRWSTAISGNKTSGGLAHRLAEGASPYLRAGLDELRSIFDVDSDPIPISALDEDDSNADEEMSRDRGGEISVNLTSPTSEYPSPSVEVSRTSSLDGGFGMGLGLYRASSLSSRSSKSTSQPKPTEAIEKAAQRAEDGTMDVAFSAAGLGINRGILAWSLALIAIGMTALCAYGYAMRESILLLKTRCSIDSSSLFRFRHLFTYSDWVLPYSTCFRLDGTHCAIAASSCFDGPLLTSDASSCACSGLHRSPGVSRPIGIIILRQLYQLSSK